MARIDALVMQIDSKQSLTDFINKREKAFGELISLHQVVTDDEKEILSLLKLKD